MKKYAQINENNICIATAELSEQVIVPSKWVQISDENVLGKKYNNGMWEDVPEPEPEPTQLDRIEEQLKLTYTEAQEQAVDAYTKELLEGGII